uniref:Uncharacterized protein n=1 Tax=Populus trichocarpa TaxID=3694 RepID=A0A2K1ZYT9_POPTR
MIMSYLIIVNDTRKGGWNFNGNSGYLYVQPFRDTKITTLYKITTLNGNEQGLELPKFKRYRKITTLEIRV